MKNTKYLSDHGRIIVLEKKIRELSVILGLYITDSDRMVQTIGQVVEVPIVSSITKAKTLRPVPFPEFWETESSKGTVKTLEITEKTCSVVNRLKNPGEIS